MFSTRCSSLIGEASSQRGRYTRRHDYKPASQPPTATRATAHPHTARTHPRISFIHTSLSVRSGSGATHDRRSTDARRALALRRDVRFGWKGRLGRHQAQARKVFSRRRRDSRRRSSCSQSPLLLDVIWVRERQRGRWSHHLDQAGRHAHHRLDLLRSHWSFFHGCLQASYEIAWETEMRNAPEGQ